MPNGQMIQKDYDYKCVYNPKSFDYQKMTPKQMYHARLFDIVVYRITYTNVDGKVFEFSTQQVKEFCKNTVYIQLRNSIMVEQKTFFLI
jgi:hypothetical protein